MTETSQADNSVERLPRLVPAGIRIVSSRLRSANLERDSDIPDIGPIYMNGRVLDILSRLAAAIDDSGRSRAWSLTGPYGSGKSTIALLITALLGPDNIRRREAEKLLASANPDLASRISDARDRIAPRGFITAIATARRESVPETLQRALTRGANRRWPDGKSPRRISVCLKALRSRDAGSADVLAALGALCDEAPVLLVVDEFGKILEHLAREHDSGSMRDDVYALQEIAEAGAGPAGLPLFTLTLQHLSFLDYSAHSAGLQRREWAKVQGRFEDITFTPDPGDAVQLIRRSISHEDLIDSGGELVGRHGAASAVAWSQLGLQGVLPADADLFAALYPLHPLTAAIAPLVAAQVGQNDRSLAGFLAGDEPSTVERFVTSNEGVATNTAASTVKLPQLYDYFFGSGRTTMLASAAASRWIEIDLILSEAHGLDEQDLQILKTIGILNLVDASGALRACPGTISFALNDPMNEGGVSDECLLARLANLAERGFVVYRKYNDEYRIWRGSAIDLQVRIGEARERCDDHTVVKMLAAQLPAAVVAGRHSQRTGMLRHFITTATEPGTDVPTPDENGPADGILIFHFGDHGLPEIRSSLPVVVGTTKNARAVLDAGREVIALEETLSAGGLDTAAVRELTERAGQARVELTAVLATAFSPGKSWTRWVLVNPSRDEPEARDADLDPKILEGHSLARVVSDACDMFYRHTPHIRNEMLGRHQLTSQGAKARRELITAMLTQPSGLSLGISGYGPERAMYDGVVAYMGLHRPRAGHREPMGTHGEYEFTAPGQESTLAPAWEALRRELATSTRELPMDELFRLLMAPPFGVKAGAVPVIVTAALIIGRGEIAVFEEGTYQPVLTPDLMERLIKAPNRYSLKYAPATEGQRHLVLQQIAESLGLTGARTRSTQDRNPALLIVTRELLNQVRGLTAYAAGTKRLTERALAVRNVLKAARDPDELLFTTLPHVLGLPLIPVGGPRDDDIAAKFAGRLAEALSEIRDADKVLRAEVAAVLAREFRLPSEISAMRRVFAGRMAAFAEQISEPELRGLLSLALNEGLSDDEWLDPMVVRIVHVGLASWTDGHLGQFVNGARRLARAVDRLTDLYEPGICDAQPLGGQVQLVSVTSNDGREERVLVHVPDTLRDAASRLADEVAVTADQLLGVDGRRILLATLAQTLAASYDLEKTTHA